MWRFNVPQLEEFLAFSVEDRYQLNYVICNKDFNTQTIISLKLTLFSFFIYCCTICLDIFLLSDRQYLLSVSWRLHITITFNLLHLRLSDMLRLSPYI
jgi:hypothetical protein